MTIDEAIRFIAREADDANIDGMPELAAQHMEVLSYLKEFEHLNRVVAEFVARWEKR